jgi:predicted transcriptional regulator
MLTKTQSKERDMKVVEFVNLIPCFSDTIQKIFYQSRSMANDHLSKLVNYGYIKRHRKFAHERYFYYTGKLKKRKDHYDIIAKTYHWLQQNDYEIINCKVQQRQNNIEPDMIIEIKQDNNICAVAVEIERANKNIKNTIKKYQNTEFNNLFLVSHLPTGMIKSEYINLLYNINFKELE